MSDSILDKTLREIIEEGKEREKQKQDQRKKNKKAKKQQQRQQEQQQQHHQQPPQQQPQGIPGRKRGLSEAASSTIQDGGDDQSQATVKRPRRKPLPLIQNSDVGLLRRRRLVQTREPPASGLGDGEDKFRSFVDRTKAANNGDLGLVALNLTSVNRHAHTRRIDRALRELRTDSGPPPPLPLPSNNNNKNKIAGGASSAGKDGRGAPQGSTASGRGTTSRGPVDNTGREEIWKKPDRMRTAGEKESLVNQLDDEMDNYFNVQDRNLDYE